MRNLFVDISYLDSLTENNFIASWVITELDKDKCTKVLCSSQDIYFNATDITIMNSIELLGRCSDCNKIIIDWYGGELQKIEL